MPDATEPRGRDYWQEHDHPFKETWSAPATCVTCDMPIEDEHHRPTEPTLDTYRRFLQLAYNGLCGALGELRAAQVYDLAEWVTAIRAAVADRQFPENAPHPGASLLADLAEKERRIGELEAAFRDTMSAHVKITSAYRVQGRAPGGAIDTMNRLKRFLATLDAASPPG